MGDKKLGPVCSTRVGDDWIDDGTLCRAKSASPGPVGVAKPDPAKAQFDTAHGYSLAPEARRKRAIDLEIIGSDYAKSGEISIDSETYLKRLIEIASEGRRKVQSSGKGSNLQFFIIRGGAEGFLPDDLRKIDARNNVTNWTGTDGKVGETDFDENDLLAVFDASGNLIAAARLRRPTFVQGQISRPTAAAVYEAWAGKTVLVYKNETPGWIPYLGLALDDGFRDGSNNTVHPGEKVSIDLHKEEQTNGCIFIVDPATPALGTPDLRTFEPQLIKKVIAAKGLNIAKIPHGGTVIGKMLVVTISL